MLDRTAPTTPCTVCGRPDLSALLEKGGQRYCQCGRCGHIAMDPLPDLGDQEAFYKKQYAEGVYKGYMDARPLKLRTFDRRLDAILRAVPTPGRMLDVGCASGAFVEAARSRGLDAWGVEQVPDAVLGAPAGVKPYLLVKNVEREELKGEYGLVTFFDVLEHMREPQAFLGRMRSLLRPAGYIALTCPDRTHFLRYLMGKRWPHFQPFQHFHLFGGSDLRTFLEQGGFTVLEQRRVGKVLTWDYLSGQLEANNAFLSRGMRTAAKLVPTAVRNWPMEIGIGEIMAIARLRPP